MTTTYWRFAYDDQRLEDIVSSGKLEFPRFSQWPSAKNNSIEKVCQKLRAGHYVLLANFDSAAAEGRIVAVGKVTARQGDDFAMDWKRPPSVWRVQPNPQGGVAQWTNECVFKFNPEPAKRYRLPLRIDDLFAVPEATGSEQGETNSNEA